MAHYNPNIRLFLIPFDEQFFIREGIAITLPPDFAHALYIFREKNHPKELFYRSDIRMHVLMQGIPYGASRDIIDLIYARAIDSLTICLHQQRFEDSIILYFGKRTLLQKMESVLRNKLFGVEVALRDPLVDKDLSRDGILHKLTAHTELNTPIPRSWNISPVVKTEKEFVMCLS